VEVVDPLDLGKEGTRPVRPYVRPSVTTKEPGHCYQVAAEFLLLHPHAPEDGVVVHGDPVLQVPPFCRYGHAWVETRWGDRVIDRTMSYDGPSVFFYTVGQIDFTRCKRYNREDLCRAILESGTWGPWED